MYQNNGINDEYNMKKMITQEGKRNKIFPAIDYVDVAESLILLKKITTINHKLLNKLNKEMLKNGRKFFRSMCSLLL